MATHSSILENHMDRGDWKVHGVTKSQTQLETDHAHVCVCVCVCEDTHTKTGTASVNNSIILVALLDRWM